MGNILYSDILEIVKDDKKAKKLVDYFEKRLEETKNETKDIATITAREETQHQTNIIKHDIRDELRKELATKEDISMVKTELKNDIYMLDKKIDEVDKKIDNEIKLLKRDLIIVIIIMSIVGPEIFKFISLFK